MLRRPLVLSTLLAVVAGLLALAAPAHAAPVSPKLRIYVDVWNQAPTREYGTYVPITAQTEGTNGFNGVPGSFEVRRNGAWVSRGWTSTGAFSTGLWEEDPAGVYEFEFEFVPDDLATYLPETKTLTIVRPKASVSLDLGDPTTDVRAGTSWTLPQSNPPAARLAVRSGSTAGTCAVSARRVDFTASGTCTVDVTADEDANHLAATPRAVTFQVTQATTVTAVTWSADPVVIDEQVDLRIALKAGEELLDGTAEVWVDGQRSATVDVDGVTRWQTSFASPGRHEVEVRGTPSDPAYAPSVGTASIQVTRLGQTISSPPSPAYVGDTWRPTASGGGIVGMSSSTRTVCEVVDGQVAFRATGTCQVDSSVGSTATHEASERSDSFSVVGVPAVVDVTVVPLGAGTQRLDLEVTSPRGTPAGTVAIDGGQPATLADGRASLSSSGAPGRTLHVEIAYTPAAGSRWAPVTTVHDLVVPPAPQVVTISEPPAHPRVGETWTPTITGSPSGRPTSWTAAGACERVAGEVSFTAAGDCTVTAGQSAGDGYLAGDASLVVAVQKGRQPISFATAAPATAYVGGRWAPRASGGPSGRPVEVTTGPASRCQVVASAEDGASAPAVEFRGAGECTVTFAQQGTADYEAGTRVVTIPVALVPVELALTAADDLAVGAEGTLDVTATVDGEAVPGEITVRGGGIDVAGTVGSGAASLSATFDRAGTHALTVSFSPADAATYAASSAQTSIDVAKGTQRLSLADAAPATQPAGGSWTPTVTGGDSGSPVLVAATPAAVCTAEYGTVRFAAAGDCDVTLTQAGAADWEPAPDLRHTISVERRTPTLGVDLPSDARVGEPAVVTARSDEEGAVRFSLDGEAVGDPVAVTGGAATATLVPTAAGARLLTATLIPEARGAVAGAERQLTFHVGRAATGTAVAVDAAGLSATVTPTSSAAGVPSGEVTFVVNGAEVGVVPVVDGRAVLQRDTVAATDVEVRASYSGSADHEPSSASTVRTNPSIVAEIASSAPVRAGWHTGPVVVRFTCTGGSAPLVDACPGPVRLDRDGVADPLTRSVATQDGGRASVRVDGIRIDATSPRVRVVGVRDGATYKAGRRTPRCAGSDAGSGLADCRIERRRTGPREYEVTATATDAAGNVATRTVSHRVTRAWLVGHPAGTVVDVRRRSTERVVILGRTAPTVQAAWGDTPRVQQLASRSGLPRWRAVLRIPRHAQVGKTYVVRVRTGGDVTRLRLRVVGRR